jgi:hypothetical protein
MIDAILRALSMAFAMGWGLRYTRTRFALVGVLMPMLS